LPAWITSRASASIPSEEKPHLVLVDGHSLVMKMHFATLPAGLRNSDGQLTGAAFCFSRALLHLRSKCSHMCVVFDYGGPEQLDRTKVRSDYKGKRLEFNWMGTTHNGSSTHVVSSQVDLCKDGCRAFGVHWQHQSGKEADDLLASYALKGKAEGYQVTIVSSDKDLMQVVGDNVCMNSAWNLSPKHLIDAEKVEETFGVPPSSLGELFALSGDSCDSVGGVPGLGRKKAGQVIKQYTTIEKLYQAIDSGTFSQPGFGPVLQQRLLESRDLVLQNRQLVTLPFPTNGKFAPLHVNDLETLRLPVLNHSDAEEFIATHDFNSLRSLLSGDSSGSQPCPSSSSAGTRRSRKTPKPQADEAGDPAFTINCELTAKKALQMLSAALDKDPTALFAVGMPETTKDPTKKARTELEQEMLRAKHAETEVISSLSIAWTGSQPLVDEDGKRFSCLVMRKPFLSHITALSEFFRGSQYRKVYCNFPRSIRLLEKAYAAIPARKRKTFRHAGFAADVLDMALLWDPAISAVNKPQGVLWLRKAIERKDGGTDDDEPDASTIPHCASLVRKLWCELSARLGTTSLLEFYEKHWLHLGQVCVDMQKTGVPVRTDELEKELATKRELAKSLQGKFRRWARSRVEEVHGKSVAQKSNIEFMNVSSALQVRQLLFGPAEAVACAGVHANQAEFDRSAFFRDLGMVDPDILESMDLSGVQRLCLAHDLPEYKNRKTGIEKLEAHFIQCLLDRKAAELKDLCKHYGLRVSGTKAHNACSLYYVDRTSKTSPAPKVFIPGLGLELPGKCEKEFINQKTGNPVLSRGSLQCLLESSLPSRHVDILGPDGVDAIRTLIDLADLEAEMKTLQALQHRVTASGQLCANIDTNWLLRRGRLSVGDGILGSPAVKAFVEAPAGQKLILARYHDLTLHLAAHMGSCAAMQAHLQEDVHAKTARSLFPHVQAAIADGTAAEEGIKIKFPREWQQARSFNKGVIGGISVQRLAREFGRSTSEMNTEIDRWFQRYPGIHSLTNGKLAGKDGDSKSRCTLLGRRLDIGSDAQSTSRYVLGKILEGSAVDVIIKTLQHLKEQPKLKFKPIMQIGEDILLIGPDADGEEACRVVEQTMLDPLQGCQDELGSEKLLSFDASVQVSQRWHDKGESTG